MAAKASVASMFGDTRDEQQQRRQTFAPVQAGWAQWQAALAARDEARAALPGLRSLDLEYFADAWSGSASLDGYWSPNDPDYIHLRADLSPEVTHERVLHESAHAYLYAALRTVGGETLPERFAAGDLAARAALIGLAELRLFLLSKGNRAMTPAGSGLRGPTAATPRSGGAESPPAQLARAGEPWRHRAPLHRSGRATV